MNPSFVRDLQELMRLAAPEVDIRPGEEAHHRYRDGYANGFQGALREVWEMVEEALDE